MERTTSVLAAALASQAKEAEKGEMAVAGVTYAVKVEATKKDKDAGAPAGSPARSGSDPIIPPPPRVASPCAIPKDINTSDAPVLATAALAAAAAAEAAKAAARSRDGQASKSGVVEAARGDAEEGRDATTSAAAAGNLEGHGTEVVGDDDDAPMLISPIPSPSASAASFPSGASPLPSVLQRREWSPPSVSLLASHAPLPLDAAMLRDTAWARRAHRARHYWERRVGWR